MKDIVINTTLKEAEDLLSLHKINEAKKAIEKIQFPISENIEFITRMGKIYRKLGDLNKALIQFKNALSIEPGNLDHYYNIAEILVKLNFPNKAVDTYKIALKIDPHQVVIYGKIGHLYKGMGHREKALKWFLKTLEVAPNSPEIINLTAIILRDMNIFKEAETLLKSGIQLAPDFPKFYHTFGLVKSRQGMYSDAKSYFTRAIELEPNFYEARFSKGSLELMHGDFKNGWAGYEYRKKISNLHIKNFSKPEWDGTDYKGKTLLLHAEQGFGDTINFVRYVPRVKARGGTLLLACQPELVELLKEVKGIDKVISNKDILPEFDIYLSLLSIPYVFNTRLETIPPEVPYITTDGKLPDEIRNRFNQDTTKKKIGIVWAGNPNHKNDFFRSAGLEMFNPFTQLENIQLFSLQFGLKNQDEKNTLKKMGIIDLSPYFNNFQDTANIILMLDLVLSVDTAIVHLAGALNKPVWMVIPKDPDFRWLLDRDDSPWYPSMRIFRQQVQGEWIPVFDSVLKAMRNI